MRISAVPWRHLGAALVLVAAFAPFLDKPFHVDDPVFIDLARAVRFPLGVEGGHRFRNMGYEVELSNPYLTTHPPGIPYLLKAVATAAGSYAEIPLHTAFLVFPLLLALGTWSLARRVGADPSAAVLCVLTNAILLPNAHSVMADVPALALWTASSVLLVEGLHHERRWAIGAASAGLALACLCAYQIVLLLPLLLAFVVWRPIAWGARVRAGLQILAPAAVLGALVVALALSGRSPLEGPLSQIRAGLALPRLGSKLASIPLHCGLAFLAFFPWVLGRLLATPRLVWAVVAAAAAEGIHVWRAGYPVGEVAWLSLLFFVGIASLIAAAGSARDLSDRPLAVFLAGWIAIVLAYDVFLLPFGAARYVLTLLPPAALLLARTLPTVRTQFVVAVLTAVVGTGVAAGDYVLASAYRDFAHEIAQTVGAARQRVWFVGDWGMNHYMTEQGFRYLTRDSVEPGPGDLVFLAEVPRLWNPSPALGSRLRLVDVREVDSQYPVRTMNLAARAGYYCSLWGYNPVAVSSVPLERFGVFRVVR